MGRFSFARKSSSRPSDVKVSGTNSKHSRRPFAKKADPLKDWVTSGDRATAPKTKKSGRRGRVKAKEVAWTLDQLATTQSSGVPLFRALGMIASMKKNTPLGDRLEEIQRRIGEGVSLSAAMKEDEKTWGQLVIALIGAGETSGSLDKAFERVSMLLMARMALRRKIVGALTYPAVLITVTASLVAALLLFIVPMFEGIYESLGGELRD